MHTQTSKSSNTIAALFLIITGVIGSFMGTTPQVATLSLTASSVCPSGNGWVKYDNWSDSKKSQTHVAPNGSVVVQVCVKGGNNIEYFSANGVESCWKVSGINQQTAKAEENWGHNKPHGCRDISHASFKIRTIASPTPTPRPTVTPSPTPSATPTATPTPSETPEPSATPTPTPSETPEPDKTPRISDLFVTDPNCESNQITAAQVLKYDDKPQQNIAVVFEYQGTKKTAYTNSEGKAEVSFTYAGDGELTAKPEHGFSERKEMITKETNCSTTIASSGQVLGASTDPLIYAETGILEDTVMSIFGITGMALMAAGYVQTKKTI